MTIDEYLATEEQSSVRHEYVGGQMYAMTGATLKHNIITSNIHAALCSHLKGGPCRSFFSEVKVKVEKLNSIYYPDVVVACGSLDTDSLFAPDPVLIFEVLSPSTAAIDKREKRIAYRLIETMRAYVIVHQRKQLIQLHRRGAQGDWELTEFKAGGQLVLESIASGLISIPVQAFYEDADVPEGGDSTRQVVREDSFDEHDDQLDW